MNAVNEHIIEEPTGNLSVEELAADVNAQRIVDVPEPQQDSEKVEFDLVADMLATKECIELAATKDVVSLPPVITLNDTHIIKRNSINLIQGAYGSHKSRLAENLVALLIAKEDCSTDFWELERYPHETFSVAYIDTERNTKDELPRVLQNIRKLGGHNPRTACKQLHLYTIKKYERNRRQEATQLILRKIRQEVKNHLVVVLDVITDCLKSFNNEEASLKLYDFLGNLCEEHDCTVIAVIHENPGSHKARGHVGSEGVNKSSTVIRIGYEKNQDSTPTDIIKLEFLKLRHGKKPSPIWLRFCEKTYNLIPASKEDLDEAGINGTSTNRTDDLTTFLSQAFVDKSTIPRKELLTFLSNALQKSERTIDTYLTRLMKDSSTWINDSEGVPCALSKEGGKGKTLYYQLKKIESEDP